MRTVLCSSCVRQLLLKNITMMIMMMTTQTRQDCLVLSESAVWTELTTSRDCVGDRKFWNCFVQSRNAVRTTEKVSTCRQFCSHRRHGQDKTVLSCPVGGVNRIVDKSRLSVTESFETVLSSIEMRWGLYWKSFDLSQILFTSLTRTRQVRCSCQFVVFVCPCNVVLSFI